MSEEEKKEYKSEYKKLSFYSIGGKWGYAIIHVVDSNKEEKIRLAKCKKQEEFPQTEKYQWEEVEPKHVKNLSQVQRINFKPTDNFSNIAKKIEQELATIKVTKKTKEEKTEETEEEEEE